MGSLESGVHAGGRRHDVRDQFHRAEKCSRSTRRPQDEVEAPECPTGGRATVCCSLDNAGFLRRGKIFVGRLDAEAGGWMPRQKSCGVPP